MKRHLFSIILHALFILTAYVLQGLVFPYLKLFGYVPLILPLVCVAAAVNEGRVAGGVSGLFAGILCDISFNQPAASFAVLLTILGILAGFLAETVITQNFGSFFFCSAGVLFVISFAQMFSLLFFENSPPHDLFMTAVFQTLYSLAFTPMVYYAIRAFCRPHSG